jgi:hypothetical protein
MMAEIVQTREVVTGLTTTDATAFLEWPMKP